MGAGTAGGKVGRGHQQERVARGASARTRDGGGAGGESGKGDGCRRPPAQPVHTPHETGRPEQPYIRVQAGYARDGEGTKGANGGETGGGVVAGVMRLAEHLFLPVDDVPCHEVWGGGGRDTGWGQRAGGGIGATVSRDAAVAAPPPAGPPRHDAKRSGHCRTGLPPPEGALTSRRARGPSPAAWPARASWC
eukprot:scaffold12248_cov110-Isochrysis_galbana.AAC.3